MSDQKNRKAARLYAIVLIGKRFPLETMHGDEEGMKAHVAELRRTVQTKPDSAAYRGLFGGQPPTFVEQIIDEVEYLLLDYVCESRRLLPLDGEDRDSDSNA